MKINKFAYEHALLHRATGDYENLGWEWSRRISKNWEEKLQRGPKKRGKGGE